MYRATREVRGVRFFTRIPRKHIRIDLADGRKVCAYQGSMSDNLGCHNLSVQAQLDALVLSMMALSRMSVDESEIGYSLFEEYRDSVAEAVHSLVPSEVVVYLNPRGNNYKVTLNGGPFINIPENFMSQVVSMRIFDRPQIVKITALIKQRKIKVTAPALRYSLDLVISELSR